MDTCCVLPPAEGKEQKQTQKNDQSNPAWPISTDRSLISATAASACTLVKPSLPARRGAGAVDAVEAHFKACAGTRAGLDANHVLPIAGSLQNLPNAPQDRNPRLPTTHAEHTARTNGRLQAS